LPPGARYYEGRRTFIAVTHITREDKRTVDPVVEAYIRDIDRGLIRSSVTERFETAMAAQRFAEELRRAGREARKQETL
jgi:hypothetical protein